MLQKIKLVKPIKRGSLLACQPENRPFPAGQTETEIGTAQTWVLGKTYTADRTVIVASWPSQYQVPETGAGW
jgi:hypothetical protein